MSKAIIQIEINDSTFECKFTVAGEGQAHVLAQDILESIQQVNKQITEDSKVEQLLAPNPQFDISQIMKVKQ